MEVYGNSLVTVSGAGPEGRVRGCTPTEALTPIVSPSLNGSGDATAIPLILTDLAVQNTRNWRIEVFYFSPQNAPKCARQ